jgi:hypothetical protein
LLPTEGGKPAALGFFTKTLTQVGGKHLYLADLVLQGNKGELGFIEASPQEFHLLAGNQIINRHGTFRVYPVYPVEEDPGTVEGSRDLGKFV